MMVVADEEYYSVRTRKEERHVRRLLSHLSDAGEGRAQRPSTSATTCAFN